MANQQTGNYQLNQWAEADRILREDFNSDNEKLDAALKANADAVAALAERAGLQLIQQTELTSESDTETVALEVDWAQWGLVLLLYENANASANRTYSISLTNSGNKIDLFNGAATQHCILFFPLYNPARALRGLSWGGGSVSESKTFGVVTGVRVAANSDSNAVSGVKLTLYGLR